LWFMPNLLTGSDLSLPQDPELPFTVQGTRIRNRWMTAVLSSDPLEQERLDIQLVAELRSMAEADFNMVMFPLQSGVIPWPDPDDLARATVADILPEIEARLANVVRIVQLASAEGLLVGFNLQHHCLKSNAVAELKGCQHIGGMDGFPRCDSNRIATAKEWHKQIFKYLEDKLTPSQLRSIVELAPVAHSRKPGGGDPSFPYTLRDPCHEESEEYLREVIPHLQTLTDIPLVAAVKPDRFRSQAAEQYAPIRGLLTTLPSYSMDFLDVTSYFEDRRFNEGNPVTLEPQRVVDAIGASFSTKIILSDMNVRNTLTPLEFALPPEQQHQLALERAPCNIKFHLDQVPETAFDLAGTWFLANRGEITMTPQTALGIRERNCGLTTGSLSECFFNDPDDYELLSAFTRRAVECVHESFL